jgi:hypothetical protein
MFTITTSIVKDSTDVTLYALLYNSVTWLPRPNANLGLMSYYYILDRQAIVGPTPAVVLASATAAHTDNGIYSCGRGLFRVDLPDLFSGAIGSRVNFLIDSSEILACNFSIEIIPPRIVAGVEMGITDAGVAKILDTAIEV